MVLTLHRLTHVIFTLITIETISTTRTEIRVQSERVWVNLHAENVIATDGTCSVILTTILTEIDFTLRTREWQRASREHQRGDHRLHAIETIRTSKCLYCFHLHWPSRDLYWNSWVFSRSFPGRDMSALKDDRATRVCFHRMVVRGRVFENICSHSMERSDDRMGLLQRTELRQDWNAVDITCFTTIVLHDGA